MKGYYVLRKIITGVVLVTCLVSLVSCAGKRPANLGVSDGSLAACPSSPNCVSSDSTDSGHNVSPFRLAVAPQEGWRVVRELVSALPRTTIVEVSDSYLYAECRSRIFRFVDDLELHLRPDDGIVVVRSASRVGSSDFGVNRDRIEHLRSLAASRGVLTLP